MGDYVRENRERNARIIVGRAELTLRRDESRAVRRPDHVDLRPPIDFVHPVTGRREVQPDPRLVDLGRYLRRGRRYASKSQQRVADETGVTQSMISRAERGLAPAMGLGRLVMLCDALARLFPLGICPHDHECAWQPIHRPERQKTAVELLVALLDDPEGDSAPAALDETPGERSDEPVISVTIDDLPVGALHSAQDSDELW